MVFFFHIKNPYLPSLLSRWGWRDIGLVLVSRVYRLLARSKNMKKGTWTISSHLDRTSLVNSDIYWLCSVEGQNITWGRFHVVPYYASSNWTPRGGYRGRGCLQIWYRDDFHPYKCDFFLVSSCASCCRKYLLPDRWSGGRGLRVRD